MASKSPLVSKPDDPPATRVLRADAQRNYERLVAAARDVFAKEGGSASMEAIAREAGVGVGTLYRHFPQRIDVVEAVYRDEVDQLVAAADHAMAEFEPWPAVVAFLEAFVRYAQGKRTFLNELHEAFEKHPDLRLHSKERIDDAMDRIIRRARRRGRHPYRRQRCRAHAAGQSSLHQRDAVRGSEQPVAQHDPRRAASPVVAAQVLDTDLPEVIGRYFGAHDRRDTDAALATFAADAVVIDDGHEYTEPR